MKTLLFAKKIVQSLFFLNPKFQASSYLLWLYGPVCVGPGRKPQKHVFLGCGLNMIRAICKKELLLLKGWGRESHFPFRVLPLHKVVAFDQTKKALGNIIS